MSDGGGSKEIELNNNTTTINSNTRKPAGNEDFVRAIAKIAVAQLFENEGFQGFQPSALEALADVAIRYIKEIGKTSNLYANLANRSECNVFDVIQGLENLGSIQGFPGASDVHNSLANSGTIREINQYVRFVDDIPFVYSVPRFPVVVPRECKTPKSFCQLGEEPPGEHIPAWLPAFPRLESRVDDSNVGNGGEEKEKLLNNGGPPLLNMEQGLGVNDGSVEIFGVNPVDSSKIKKPAEMNPFLVPPLLSGEKEVSCVDPPSRFLGGEAVGNHFNVMETFAPIIEAAKTKLSENEEGCQNTNKSSGRPTVRFKFSSSLRKSLPISTNVIAQNNGDEKLAICFEKDEAKDEKKRRAEQILKESMENPLGPAQL